MAGVPKPVHFVEIGGEARPVRFGWNALALYNDLTGTTLAELQAAFAPPEGAGEGWMPPLTAGQLVALVFAGLSDGARKERQPFEATPEDVGDWLDEAGEEALGEVFAAFQGAHDTGEAADAKKKPQGKPKAKPKAGA